MSKTLEVSLSDLRFVMAHSPCKSFCEAWLNLLGHSLSAEEILLFRQNFAHGRIFPNNLHEKKVKVTRDNIRKLIKNLTKNRHYPMNGIWMYNNRANNARLAYEFMFDAIMHTGSLNRHGDTKSSERQLLNFVKKQLDN